jgi:pimeloyl-ACP methyl ester carboxylesterase
MYPAYRKGLRIAMGLEGVGEIERLNAWEALGPSLGAARARRLRARAYTLVDRYVQDGGEGPQAFEGMARDFSCFSRRELQYLIAEYVHQVVPPLVYVSQAIHDQHLLAAPGDEGRKRLAEAQSFTLKDYEEKIGVPRRRLVSPGADVKSLSARGSLGPVLQRLRSNPRVHIMHNADDILATRISIEETSEAMGAQMTVYPHGGHLGNLWYPENEAQILGYFRTAVARRPEPHGHSIASWITGAGFCP